MSQFVRVCLGRGVSRIVFVGLTSAFLAGCSSDSSRFADFGSSPFQSSARVDQTSSFGNSPQMASAAPVSAVQSSPLSAPIQSAPLSAPVRAAYVPPMAQPRVIASAPVRASAHTAPQATSPNIAAARAVIARPATQTAVAPVAKPTVTNVARAEPAKAAHVVEAPAAKPVRTASLEPAARSDASPTAAAASVAAAEDASPEFRWPARGRIIQGFKAGKSEGISIAVPEGTSVKAAEGGTVAYAGSELKGYGNLVLIRHPNGFVSAYAHNGELMVKRGETVKRGQVVAKSGQSGDVSSPQLQFQLRKGSTPVDPTQYLAGL
jgi:murein DD-endopeptidase MepM/ murein hydrolase activator NlpD